MKLNQRERFMLIALGILAVIAASYYFIIKPQLDRIDSLTVEEATVQQEIEDAEAELAAGAELDEEMAAIGIEIEEMCKVFYPEILKEKIIVTLDELVNRTEIENKATSYGKTAVGDVIAVPGQTAQSSYHLRDLADKYNALHPKDDQPLEPSDPEDEEALPQELRKLEIISTKLQLDGTYEQLVEFIKEIEALEKSIVISNLIIVKGEEEKIAASMDIIFYAIPKIHDQDEEYYEWTYENEYGKENPF